MNIYAKHGDKVTVTKQSFENGYKHDRDKAKKHLKIGSTYTVDRTIVHGWSTEVYLVEIPRVSFNSVQFVDLDKAHIDYDISDFVPPNNLSIDDIKNKVAVDLGYVGWHEIMDDHMLSDDICSKLIEETIKRLSA